VTGEAEWLPSRDAERPAAARAEGRGPDDPDVVHWWWNGLGGSEAYKTLAEGVPAILYIDAPDEESTNLYTSPQIEEILGYSPEEWINRPGMWLELLHPDDFERVTRLNDESNANGGTDLFLAEYRLRARDGRIVWFRDEALMVRDEAGSPLFWRGVMLDITELKLAEEKLQRSLEILRRTMEQRQALVARLEVAQEEERRRIAADIHDDPIQVMSAADMRIQALVEEADDGPARTALAEVHTTVALAIERLRTLLFELRPPALDQQGLVAALKIYLKHIGAEAGLDTAVEGRLAAEPPGEVRAILFRIAQEAVANVRKHAQATRIDVHVSDHESGILLRVRDDGRGFDPVVAQRPLPGHLGMSAMPERAELAGGWCRVDSAPGSGTVVECWLPGRPPIDAASTRSA
jgi:PAS domain S-box-containing protein